MDIKPEDIDKFKTEQQQELLESIRHFIKYKSLANVIDECSVPDSYVHVLESLTKLYEVHYEPE